jgi:hypothetical protein
MKKQKKDYLLGEVQRMRIMAPGKSTLFLNGRIANRLGNSTDSAIFSAGKEERKERNNNEISTKRIFVYKEQEF